MGVVAGAVFAGKGGGKPGGGGGGPPPDYAVAYTRGPLGSNPIYAMTADGGEVSQITSFDVYDLSWHPDGGGFLTTCMVDGAPGAYLVDLPGSRTWLFDTARVDIDLDMSPVPTPTGERLIAYRESGSLWVRDEDGSNPVELATGAEIAGTTDVLLGGCAFHPDGDKIALAVSVPAGTPPREMYVALVTFGKGGDGNAVATSITRLTGLVGTDLEGLNTSHPVFSNSGDTLAVTVQPRSDTFYDEEIWFVDLNDLTNVTYVTDGLDGVWDANDGMLYFLGGMRSGRATGTRGCT